jgi:DedD protein
VHLARTRARQRLIGAAVLVIAGIIGFPLIFETQPRPIPVDLPIDIPRKDNAAPLTMPQAPPVAKLPVTPASAVSASDRPAPVTEHVITETPADAGREVPVPASAPASSPTSRPLAPPPRAAASVAAKPGGGDGARALALLEGKPGSVAPASAAATGRFVVQVGAFTDAAAVKEARAKAEKLGMKTYTQVADTPAGARTRVRVGPFATRDEAERAASKLKAAALPTVILTL